MAIDLFFSIILCYDIFLKNKTFVIKSAFHLSSLTRQRSKVVTAFDSNVIRYQIPSGAQVRVLPLSNFWHFFPLLLEPTTKTNDQR
jgi:hypothetical protein